MTALLIAAGIGMLALAVGYVAGRLANAQRQVNSILKKELTRPNLGRLSTGQPWPQPRVVQDVHQSQIPDRDKP